MQLRQADEVAARLREAQALEARAPAFLREDNAQMATAGLVQRLESVVAQASPGNRACAISNRSPTPSRQGQERFERVTVHVRIRCGNSELAAVLHALEGGTPRLFIDNLGIIAPGFFALPGRPMPERNRGLDVEFDLYGYLRPAPERAATAGGADAT
jgi:general secretion pathway protein M